jgi:hypothetical protein
MLDQHRHRRQQSRFIERYRFTATQNVPRGCFSHVKCQPTSVAGRSVWNLHQTRCRRELFRYNPIGRVVDVAMHASCARFGLLAYFGLYRARSALYINNTRRQSTAHTTSNLSTDLLNCQISGFRLAVNPRS